MRSSVFFAAAAAAAGLASSAFAQEASYVAGLTSYFSSLNLTSLASVITQLNDTATGQSIFTRLASGKPYTFLAPSNDAWSGVNPYFGADPVWLGQALAYHIIPGTLDFATVHNSSNITVASTLLNDQSLVHLLADQSQHIGFTYIDGIVHVANQDYPSVILDISTYQNLQVAIVSAVVDLPPSTDSLLTLSSIAQSHELSTLVSHLPSSLLTTLSVSPTITFFAPINQAFTDALASGHISPNTDPSAFLALFENHIINGTLVFSGSPQTNYTSAGGQELTVGTGGLSDGSGSVVYYRGEQVANIVYGDIITQNGVVHLIDVVLPHPFLNPTAAVSAYSAATATASASPLRRRASSRFFGARRS